MIKEVFNKISSFIKNGFFQMFSANVLNKVLSMGSNMIVTRLLTKGDFGILSYVLNIYAYFGLVSGFGLSNGALQFGTESKGSDKEFGFFKYTLKTGVIVNSILVLIGYIALFIVVLPFEEAKPLLAVYLPMLVFEYAVSIFYIILRAENRIKEYARLLNIDTILKVAGTCVGAVWGLKGVFIGKYIAEILIITIVVLYLRGDIQRFKDGIDSIRCQLRDLWKYSIVIRINSLNQVFIKHFPNTIY